ncbi:MAG TPA: ABC transporter permease [Caldilineae bacterium]|nr:ABC transporter permease [Caldilineae bacterium]
MALLTAPLRSIQRLLGLWRLAFQRLWHTPALSFALLAGWLAAVTLISAIPMYTDAINQALLRQKLQAIQNSRRPAFAFLFHYTYTGGRSKEPPWENYAALDRYLQTDFVTELGLPLRVRMHYVKSDLFQLFPTRDGNYRLGDQPLEHVALGFIADLETHLALLEGRPPGVTWSPGDPLEVLISPQLATKLGIQVGEVYILFDPDGNANTSTPFTMPVRIAGIWQASDPDAPFWYIPPESFDNTLLVSREVYLGLLGGDIPRPLFDVGWYQVLDGGNVRAGDVESFLQRMASVETRVTMLLPGARLTLSPISALRRYQRSVSTQSVLILLLSLPIVGLILLFIALIADSMVERQRLEISILRSRGSTSSQIVMTYLLQGLTLGLIALMLGLSAGRWAALAVGGTHRFLSFRHASVPLSVVITQESVQFAGIALLLALVAMMIPSWRAAHFTIILAKQSLGRPPRYPFWRQLVGDLLLLALAAYGYYLLLGQGRIALLQFRETANPWENPLLLLTPALFLLAGARVCLHMATPFMYVLERVVAWMPGITALLAIRNLARAGRRYSALIMLLLLTTGLGTFTASVARTLDENLIARTYYRIGADVAVVEAAGRLGPGATSGLVQGPSAAGSASLEEPEGFPGWALLPVSEHLRAPGVKAATRVGVFKANARIGDQVVSGILYGIDRVDFPRVAYFRRDFAPISLGALMNALAVEPSGILVRREFLAETGLNIGDTLPLRGLVAGSSQPMSFTIVGVLDLFPTAYPGEGEFFVANLDYIFDLLGGPVPYYVWLDVQETVDATTLAEQLEEIGFRILKIEDARQQIVEAQAHPERVGLFGFLSLGFIVIIFLSMLALSTHALLIYQQRYVQIGIMRAIGFSWGQMVLSLAGEQVLLVAFGILGGAVLGTIASFLFIPFMQIGHTEMELIPPFEVVIAWRDVIHMVTALAVVSLAIIGGVIWALSRLKVFQSIKLGEVLS